MSANAKLLFESMKGLKEQVQATLPGLRDVLPEGKAEMSRLGTQGAMELASALFNGHGFVPYGPGQYTPTPQHEQGSQERGMQR